MVHLKTCWPIVSKHGLSCWGEEKIKIYFKIKIKICIHLLLEKTGGLSEASCLNYFNVG